MAACSALTLAGRPCRARALAGSDRCRTHWRVEPVFERQLEATVLDAAASGDWRAAAWALERLYPERWARSRPKVEPAAARDSLDELAGRRAARKAGG